MIGAIGHFLTITKHRHEVIKNCFRAGIPFRGLLHDLSKYSPTEFITGAKFYQGTRSPNDREREVYGYSKAWIHHKGRNKHHFEYWTDYNLKEGKVLPVKMPMKYVIEMFCDRMAASKIYQGENYTDESALNYFLNSSVKKLVHPETYEMIEYLLIMLSEKGEDETFKYIRKIKKDEY